MLFVCLLAVLCLCTFRAKLPFAPAPNGAIAMKIGEFQKFDNNFFWESHYCNFIKVNGLYSMAAMAIQF